MCSLSSLRLLPFRLAKRPPTLALPLDLPREPEAQYAGEWRPVTEALFVYQDWIGRRRGEAEGEVVREDELEEDDEFVFIEGEKLSIVRLGDERTSKRRGRRDLTELEF
jgi:hypothetical protein